MASFYDNIKAGLKSGKYKSTNKFPKYIYESNKRGRKVKKLNPKWTAEQARLQKVKEANDKKPHKGVGPLKDGEKYSKNLKKTTQGVGPVKSGKTYGKNLKPLPKYKNVSQKQLDKKLSEKKTTEKPADKLKVNYRRTKEEGVGKGDTRTTKRLKKAGFTETRLAKLREKNAAFQKAKKGGKEAMKAYRKKYPKRG